MTWARPSSFRPTSERSPSDFAAGKYDTGYIERYKDDLLGYPTVPAERRDAVAVAAGEGRAERSDCGEAAAPKAASLQELLAEGGVQRRGPVRARGSSPARPKKSGRLARRSPDQIKTLLDKVVSAIRSTRGKGLRAEQIRAQLGLQANEMPRVLREGVASKKLKSKGQKRSTTYFLR